jgi:hypothetical protein
MTVIVDTGVLVALVDQDTYSRYFKRIQGLRRNQGSDRR